MRFNILAGVQKIPFALNRHFPFLREPLCAPIREREVSTQSVDRTVEPSAPPLSIEQLKKAAAVMGYTSQDFDDAVRLVGHDLNKIAALLLRTYPVQVHPLPA